MAVIVKTSSPADLLEEIKNQIEKGSILTWEVDDDGDFYHNPEQWEGKAWMRPQLGTDVLTFFIVPNKSETVSTMVYAVYHGRLIEMLLAHVDELFTKAEATAYPVDGDNIDND